MIDGLKLTFTGEELRRLLHQRAETHRAAVARIKLEQCSGREPTIDCSQLQDHIVEEVIDRHEWRSEVLDFIRAHVESAETYRLGSYDLEFAELLPEAPVTPGLPGETTRDGIDRPAIWRLQNVPGGRRERGRHAGCAVIASAVHTAKSMCREPGTTISLSAWWVITSRASAGDGSPPTSITAWEKSGSFPMTSGSNSSTAKF